MSSVTGMALNAIYPSGLVDRQQTAVPQPASESPLFVSVTETQTSARQENRRESNPDARRQAQLSGNRHKAEAQTSDPSRSGDASTATTERGRQALDRARRDDNRPQQNPAKMRELQDLAERDREVRRHEQAHKAIAGQYAGAVNYEYQQGPDGRRYAVAGSVDVDLQPAENPRETLQKMEKVLRAALAPSEPSAADRRIAAEANQLIQEARAEALAEQRRARNDTGDGDSTRGPDSPEDEPAVQRLVSAANENADPARPPASEDNAATENHANTTVGAQGEDDDPAQTDSDERLDELQSNMNNGVQESLLAVQEAVAELLRNQGGTLDDVELGRNINFQI